MAANIGNPQSAIEQAIKWIHRRYKSGRWSAQLSEVGCLFWADENGIVTPGKIVDDGDPHQVRLYRPEERLRVMNGYPAQNWPKLAGDFHAHPVTQSWVGQLPSPDDLFRTSVASDHWELNPPVQGISEVPLSPSFNVILLLRSGDMWVIEPDPNRSPYADLKKQKDDLAARRSRYESWHRSADGRLGRLSPTMNSTSFAQILRCEACGIQNILGGRSIVTLRIFS